MILTDSNILVRSILPADPRNTNAVRDLSVLRLRNQTLCIAPQNLIEFWVVATRPRAENGLGMDIAAAAREVAELRKLFLLLPYTSNVIQQCQHLVTTQDFNRYPGITVLNPADI